MFIVTYDKARGELPWRMQTCVKHGDTWYYAISCMSVEPTEDNKTFHKTWAARCNAKVGRA